MREHKFRAWDELGKRMFYSSEYDFVFADGRNISIVDRIEGTRINFVEPGLIVMEFVGQYDLNGKPVYEGDIQRRRHRSLLGKKNGNSYSLTSWRVGGPVSGFNALSNLWEVIGNICQNPELLSKYKLRRK